MLYSNTTRWLLCCTSISVLHGLYLTDKNRNKVLLDTKSCQLFKNIIGCGAHYHALQGPQTFLSACRFHLLGLFLQYRKTVELLL